MWENGVGTQFPLLCNKKVLIKGDEIWSWPFHPWFVAITLKASFFQIFIHQWLINKGVVKTAKSLMQRNWRDSEPIFKMPKDLKDAWNNCIET